MDHLSTPEQRARLQQLLPAVFDYIAGLPVCADGEPDWQLYTAAKRHLSEYVGWDAEACRWPASLSAAERAWLSGQEAYDAMIDALVEHIHV